MTAATTITLCSADGCMRHVHSRGLCARHYVQMWRANRRQANPRAYVPTVMGATMADVRYALAANDGPLTGAELALRTGHTRAAIYCAITYLRGMFGPNVIATTHRGYVMPPTVARAIRQDAGARDA